MSFADRAVTALQQSAGRIIRQRWFGDKARPVTDVSPEFVVAVNPGGKPAALAVMRFAFERGPDSLYFIPTVASPNSMESALGVDVADATLDRDFLHWFIDGFLEHRSIPGEMTWRWRTIGEGLPGAHAVDFSKARVIAGEQSNTSIVFDGRFIGKVFRRLQPGLNPDLEIGEFLTTDDRFPHAPKLYGLLEAERDGESYALAAMQEYVPNHGDGWTWLLDKLRNLTEDNLDDLVSDVRLLARRTAELHVALASDSENPSFAPEPFDPKSAEQLIGRVISEIEESVEGLVRHSSPAEVERIHKGMGQMMGSAHSLIGTYSIRVHGDYHLGQTLRTLDNDFAIIDFEGEPSRTMEQRRMKLPALKDVAGMLRSLDYAAATIRREGSNAGLADLVQRWVEVSTSAFVSAYREVARGATVPIVPASEDAFTDALNLMIAEKAMYEVRYELNNRPDWLDIPLDALRRLAGIIPPVNSE